MPKDAGTWGLYISVLALILIVPLNIASNIVTPKFLNWWAERSSASIRKRVGKLEKQLADHEKFPAISEGEDYILRATEALTMLGGLCSMNLALLLLLLTALLPSSVDKRQVFSLVMFSLLMTALICIVVALRFSRFRTQRSPFDRDVLRKYIERLRQKQL
jgi:thiosulfate reductase cytochrome b subunit